MAVTFVLAGSRRPPGGWKCTPLGASIWNWLGLRRHDDGVVSYARANALVNASWDEYPASTATSSTVSLLVTSRYAARSIRTRRRNLPGASPAIAEITRSNWNRDMCARSATSAPTTSESSSVAWTTSTKRVKVSTAVFIFLMLALAACRALDRYCPLAPATTRRASWRTAWPTRHRLT